MIVVTRLLDHRGVYYPRTYCLDRVEIRNRKSDTQSERDALAASCTAFGDIRPDDCMRIVTIVDANGERETDELAEERFDEALDLLTPGSGGLSRMAILGTGVYRHIRDARVRPRMPRNDALPVTSFRVIREPFPQWEWAQFLATNAQTELQQRLVRSYHWSRKANLEANRQLRVLFRWFAMEAIWMVTKDDDITPRIMWALGFPTGSGAGLLSRTFTSALQAHSTIGGWRQQVESLLRAVKNFRNDSVHSGFRLQDIPRNQVRDFEQITVLACARVQHTVVAGIQAGMVTAAELLEYLPILTENNSNYINDIHGTVIYSLEHDHPAF